MTNEKIVENKKTEDTYYKINHSSGLSIIIYPKKEFHSTFAVFGTKFGSTDCAYISPENGEIVKCENGTAHFLEHKLFENENENAFERYAKTGASANAYTSFDKTCYLFSCTDNVYESLEILLDFVQSPYFTKETVEKEQGIIGQEIKMYDDDPQWRVMFNLLSSMYHVHPVKVDIAGTVDSISKITPEMLYNFYNTFYNLNNMILCVAGNIEKEKVLEIADKLLKKCEKTDIKKAAVDEPDTIVKDYVEQELSVSIPLFEFGYKESVKNGRASLNDIVSMEILLDVLCSDYSPLYRQLLDSGLINDSSFNSEYFEGNGYCAIIFSGESKYPEEVSNALKKEISRLKAEGIDKNAFERAKKALYGKNIAYLNSSESIASSLISLALSDFELFDYINEIANVSISDVTKKLMGSFDESRSVLSVIKPISK